MAIEKVYLFQNTSIIQDEVSAGSFAYCVVLPTQL